VEYEDLSPHLVHALVAREDTVFTTTPVLTGRDSPVSRLIPLLMRPKRVEAVPLPTACQEPLPRHLAQSVRRAALCQSALSKFRSGYAVKLERNYTKEEIIAMYLSTVSFGNDAYGVKSASMTFSRNLPIPSRSKRPRC
jgi:penicillin-binding protein 1A